MKTKAEIYFCQNETRDFLQMPKKKLSWYYITYFVDGEKMCWSNVTQDKVVNVALETLGQEGSYHSTQPNVRMQ